MHLNGIKHNVVTKLNPQPKMLAWTDAQMDGQQTKSDNSSS